MRLLSILFFWTTMVLFIFAFCYIMYYTDDRSWALASYSAGFGTVISVVALLVSAAEKQHNNK